MKKIILIFFILFFQINIFAEDKITISGNLEMGTSLAEYNAFLDVKLALNLYFWKFKNITYVGSRTWLIYYHNGEFTGLPYREIYYYGNKASIAGVFVKYEHYCNHVVYSPKIHGNAYDDFNKRWWSNYYGDDLTTISIGYEFELPIWTK